MEALLSAPLARTYSGVSSPSKPSSHARMVLGRFREEGDLAGLAAEAQPPMVVTDEAELSTAVCAAVVRLAHEILLRSGGLSVPCCQALPFGMATNLLLSPAATPSAPCAWRRSTSLCGEISRANCRKVSAKLTFCNGAGAFSGEACPRCCGKPVLRRGRAPRSIMFRSVSANLAAAACSMTRRCGRSGSWNYDDTLRISCDVALSQRNGDEAERRRRRGRSPSAATPREFLKRAARVRRY